MKRVSKNRMLNVLPQRNDNFFKYANYHNLVIFIHIHLQGAENKKNSDKSIIEAHFLFLHRSLGRWLCTCRILQCYQAQSIQLLQCEQPPHNGLKDRIYIQFTSA